MTVLLALLFAIGMRIVTHDGLDYRKGVIVGLASWLGVSFQFAEIFPELLTHNLGALLENGMTAAGLLAILMTIALETAAPRGRKLKTTLEVESIPSVDKFVRRFASDERWSEGSAQNRQRGGDLESVAWRCCPC